MLKTKSLNDYQAPSRPADDTRQHALALTSAGRYGGTVAPLGRDRRNAHRWSLLLARTE
jgi:hypothetical protein